MCGVLFNMSKNEIQQTEKFHQIHLPERLWQQITRDMATDSPKSEGKNAMAVFADHLQKMTHFVPSIKEVIATHYTRLFGDNVFRLDGMPNAILSTRI